MMTQYIGLSFCDDEGDEILISYLFPGFKCHSEDGKFADGVPPSFFLDCGKDGESERGPDSQTL